VDVELPPIALGDFTEGSFVAAAYRGHDSLLVQQDQTVPMIC
jgi:hypothetical protein